MMMSARVYACVRALARDRDCKIFRELAIDIAIEHAYARACAALAIHIALASSAS